MDSKLKCVFIVSDPHAGAEIGDSEGGGHEAGRLPDPMPKAAETTATSAASMASAAATAAAVTNKSTSNDLHMTNNKGDTKPSFSHVSHHLQEFNLVSEIQSFLVIFLSLKGDSMGDGANMRKSMEEIRKLQEEISALRQENIQLRVR